MKFIKNIKIYHQFFIFLILIIMASLFFSFLYLNKFGHIIDDNNNMIFRNITFGYGPLIHNLIENGSYSSKFFNNIDFVLQKLPVLPLLIFLIAKVTNNFYLIVVLKNLITFSILYWVIIFYLKSLKLNIHYLYIYLLIFLVPYNMFVALSFEFADNITSILFPSLFLILMSNINQKYLISTIIIFFLYLTKISMLFVCLAIPVIIFLFDNKKSFTSKTNIIFLGPLVAMLLWGTFSYLKTERVAIGTGSLTVNSLGLTIASDERFLDYYPDKSVDILLYKIHIPSKLKNEWELYDYYKKKNEDHFSKEGNLEKYLMTLPKKIMVILFYIKRDSTHPDADENFKNPIRYSFIFSKFFINFSILLSLYSTIQSIRKNSFFKNDFIFMSMLGLSLLPLIAGWATAKHLVPISILCFFYIVYKIQIFKKIINNQI